MDSFQQHTAAIFIRRWMENAVDRGDMDEVRAMSRRLDEMTVLALQKNRPAPLTATGGRA